MEVASPQAVGQRARPSTNLAQRVAAEVSLALVMRRNACGLEPWQAAWEFGPQPITLGRKELFRAKGDEAKTMLVLCTRRLRARSSLCELIGATRAAV